MAGIFLFLRSTEAMLQNFLQGCSLLTCWKRHCEFKQQLPPGNEVQPKHENKSQLTCPYGSQLEHSNVLLVCV